MDRQYALRRRGDGEPRGPRPDGAGIGMHKNTKKPEKMNKKRESLISFQFVDIHK
jgi:hypothetical protein